MDARVKELLPSPEEYNTLRAAVGWGTYDTAAVALSLPKSLFCVCACCDDRVVGMARVVGDATLVQYVQDVVVLPEFQNRGIGKSLMDAVMAYVGAHATDNSVVGLMSAKGKESFYERYGFVRRPNEQLGSGMTLFWKGTVHAR
jgi:ribosomal protein S18 acetylase RimI-like enzyme